MVVLRPKFYDSIEPSNDDLLTFLNCLMDLSKERGKSWPIWVLDWEHLSVYVREAMTNDHNQITTENFLAPSLLDMDSAVRFSDVQNQFGQFSRNLKPGAFRVHDVHRPVWEMSYQPLSEVIGWIYGRDFQALASHKCGLPKDMKFWPSIHAKESEDGNPYLQVRLRSVNYKRQSRRENWSGIESFSLPPFKCIVTAIAPHPDPASNYPVILVNLQSLQWWISKLGPDFGFQEGDWSSGDLSSSKDEYVRGESSQKASDTWSKVTSRGRNTATYERTSCQ